MSTNSLFPLIGSEVEKVEWVITTKLRPDLAFPQDGQNSFLSATQYPLLKAEHIPLKWLKSNPGFPLLLIEPSDLDQNWVYHPYDRSKKHFQLRQRHLSHGSETLIVLEENATSADLEAFGKDKKFIYRDRENFELMKNTDYQIFNSYLFCFQSSWRPHKILFQNSQYSKCLRPHIVHALHLGGVIDTLYWEQAPAQVNELWYGQWELFNAI